MKYNERQGVGTVVATYQADLGGVPTPTSDEPRCTIEWNASKFATNVTQPYRHLFTTLPQKAQALEDHLNKMTTVLSDAHAFGQGDLAPLEAVGLPSQEMVCNIGRICSSVRFAYIRCLVYKTVDGCHACRVIGACSHFLLCTTTGS